MRFGVSKRLDKPQWSDNADAYDSRMNSYMNSDDPLLRLIDLPFL